jgi:selenocysteine lyase/cysteine desulfurase
VRVKAAVVRVLSFTCNLEEDLSHTLKEMQPRLQFTEDQYNHWSAKQQVLLVEFASAHKIGVIHVAPNKITLTFAVSRALGQLLSPGDEIVVTHLDHDANVAPWLLLARDTGAIVRWVDIREEDCTLDMASFKAAITDKTKIVATGYASNAVGTIHDVKTIVEMAHAVKALAYIDAVQYAPHGLTDVRALGCDFLVCSAYKFFGPHVGILYGKLDLLERLSAYKVRPADDRLPYKFETGTLNHERIAGTRAAVEYLAQIPNIKAGARRGRDGGNQGV